MQLCKDGVQHDVVKLDHLGQLDPRLASPQCREISPARYCCLHRLDTSHRFGLCRHAILRQGPCQSCPERVRLVHITCSGKQLVSGVSCLVLDVTNIVASFAPRVLQAVRLSVRPSRR